MSLSIIGVGSMFTVISFVLCKAAFNYGTKYNPDNYEFVTNKNVSYTVDYMRHLYNIVYKCGKAVFYPFVFVMMMQKLYNLF